MKYLHQILIACVAAAWCATGGGVVSASASPPRSNAAPVVAEAPRIAHIVGRVVNVVDGDTLDVEIDTRIEVPGEGGVQLVDHGPRILRVRLLADLDGRGCWASESRTLNLPEKRRGLAAKANLNKLAMGQSCVVDLKLVSRRLIDYLTLERALAVVRVDGKSLGELQIQAKHASSTKGGRLGL